MRKRVLNKIYDAHRGHKPEVFEFMEEGNEDYTPSVTEWVKSYAEQDVYKNRYDNKPFPKETYFPWPSGLSVKEKLASVMQAMKDLDNGNAQGTVAHPENLADSSVDKETGSMCPMGSNSISLIRYIENMLKNGEDYLGVEYNDGWNIVEMDDDKLFVALTGQGYSQVKADIEAAKSRQKKDSFARVRDANLRL